MGITYAAGPVLAASPIINTKVEAPEIPTLKAIELPAINAPITFAAAPAIHPLAAPLAGPLFANTPAITYASGPLLATTAVKTTVEAIEAPKAEVVEVAE